ncbi:hypothetical protein [Pedobacter insulae]|nr:hypothetical protein [Pedobacter insulae]
MNKIRILFLLILLSGIANFALAQDSNMYKTLVKTINVNSSFFHSGDFYEKAVFFTINMSVNEKGMIDSVIFSNEKNKDLTSLLDITKISLELKKNKTDFIRHKNEVLVLLVMVSRGENYFLNFKNGEEILNNWIEISSTANKIKIPKRKQIFLSPMLINSQGAKYPDKF